MNIDEKQALMLYIEWLKSTNKIAELKEENKNKKCEITNLIDKARQIDNETLQIQMGSLS